MAVSMAALVLLIALLSIVSGLDVHQQAQKTAAESLAAAQHVIDDLDDLRQRERQAQMARAADSSLLRVAVAEAPASDASAGDGSDRLQRTRSELAGNLHADAVGAEGPKRANGGVSRSDGAFLAGWRT